MATAEQTAVTKLTVFKAIQAFYRTRTSITGIFEVSRAATIKIMVFWNVISSILV